MSVRAGAYAEFEGTVYPCASVRKPMIRLFARGDLPAPEGFEAHPGGRWTRLVGREEVARLFVVATDATWRGHEVRVEQDCGDRMQVWSRTYPPPDHPAVRPDRDSWSAMVPAAELRDVVETVTEVPL